MTIASFEMYWAGSEITRPISDTLLEGGIILSAEGILNRKWDDFAAAEVAEEMGLREREINVNWDYTHDDTPSSLTCRVLFPELSPGEIEKRFAGYNT